MGELAQSAGQGGFKSPCSIVDKEFVSFRSGSTAIANNMQSVVKVDATSVELEITGVEIPCVPRHAGPIQTLEGNIQAVEESGSLGCTKKPLADETQTGDVVSSAISTVTTENKLKGLDGADATEARESRAIAQGTDGVVLTHMPQQAQIPPNSATTPHAKTLDVDITQPVAAVNTDMEDRDSKPPLVVTPVVCCYPQTKSLNEDLDTRERATANAAVVCAQTIHIQVPDHITSLEPVDALAKPDSCATPHNPMVYLANYSLPTRTVAVLRGTLGFNHEL
ncbi:hypothetical protein SARC_11005 [Sphaeroforma arctica JP610]|uniref:Uncharacterized protein n=1 Tax=Sphaeroforma arctica JP610 TaxID=667725 RepID=A0A0L0FKE3_9EUKA|nr:hypothetical protein SARC_11005 [Sphaeroforma arctica JP610]KNC76498.1 hypothetical protein SARC_11005 [Sphaeroforma arctica JP610]|eukprot:XP_014150400.1 hypothetical protein SARC_11005 [Sphaeroforma arctica JP610]